MTSNKLYDCLDERILLLDGGFGTMVQSYGLGEEEYRGERFRRWEVQLKGCNDLLALTRPDTVREIHEKYLRAGADIIVCHMGLTTGGTMVSALSPAAVSSSSTGRVSVVTSSICSSSRR